MKTILKVTILIILIISGFPGYCQSFELYGDSLFGIQIINLEDSTRFAYKYVFRDMDMDGDLDLFLFGLDESDTTSESIVENLRYFIEVQENIGDKWNPEFKAREKRFENYNYPKNGGFFIPCFGDINADGKQDIVFNAEVDSNLIQYLRFDIQTNDFNFETSLCTDYDLNYFIPGSIFFPELLDLDMDGDLDLLLSGGVPSPEEKDKTLYGCIYAKNTGTQENPEYLGWFTNPYGLKSDTFPTFLTGGDIDMDGDMDILAIENGDSLIYLNFYENHSGTDGRPSFSGYVQSPFGLPTLREGEGVTFPSLTDIDGDGDLDLFLPYKHIDTIYLDNNTFKLDTFFSLDYYENKLCNIEQEYISDTICRGEVYLVGDMEFTTSGDYDVELMMDTGCKKVTHLTLEVIPDTTVYIEEQLCYGEIYIVGGQEFTESGVYELSLKSLSGCDSTVVADLEFVELDTNITKEGSVLTAHFADNYAYQWFDCNTNEDMAGATENVFEPGYSGDFAVKIINDIGCEAISGCYHVIATGLKSVVTENEIALMPNPTMGKIIILNKTGKKINSVELYNLSGQFIKNYSVDKFNSFNIWENSDGIYLIKIKIKDKIIVKRIVLLK